MPIPKPTAGESQDDFMGRCMGDDTMVSEYPENDQRVAICMSSFSDGKKEIDMDLALEPEDAVYEQKFFETGELTLEAEIKAVAEEGEEGKGMFTGYASVFGNKDLGNDVMQAGAFRKSLRSKGARKIKMLYQHDTKEPIGVYTMIKEDGAGLYVEGKLAMGTQKGREVYELMKMGAIDGLSVGYRVDSKGYHYDDRSKRRILKEVDLMEISAVTFPMNPKARISGVKSERSIREWEAFLRDEGGLSRTEAKMAANAVTKALDQREVGDEQSDVMASITKLTNILKGD